MRVRPRSLKRNFHNFVGTHVPSIPSPTTQNPFLPFLPRSVGIEPICPCAWLQRHRPAPGQVRAGWGNHARRVQRDSWLAQGRGALGTQMDGCLSRLLAASGLGGARPTLEGMREGSRTRPRAVMFGHVWFSLAVSARVAMEDMQKEKEGERDRTFACRASLCFFFIPRETGSRQQPGERGASARPKSTAGRTRAPQRDDVLSFPRPSSRFSAGHRTANAASGTHLTAVRRGCTHAFFTAARWDRSSTRGRVRPGSRRSRFARDMGGRQARRRRPPSPPSFAVV